MVAIVSIFAALSLSDVLAFTAALRDGGARPPTTTPELATAVLNGFAEHIGDMLSMLGGRRQTADDPIVLLPYDKPTYEVLSSSVPRGHDIPARIK
jgi:hypothetical protein